HKAPIGLIFHLSNSMGARLIAVFLTLAFSVG
ncbi:MAG: hypothetical protein RL584_1992, partial [Pseudomonadota bacterium]